MNCYFTTVTTGFQYTFSSGSTGDFSLIGAGGVSSIENSFNSISSADTSTPPTYVYNYSVTVPSGSGANGVSVQATWPSNTGTQTLLISGPNDNGTYYALGSSGLPSNDDFLTSYTTSTSQSVMSTGSATSTSVLLPTGTYNFEVQSSYEFSSTSDVSFTNQLYYESAFDRDHERPDLGASPSSRRSRGFAAGALAANTTVTLYAGTSNTGYMGKEVGSFAYSVGSNGNLQNVPSIDLSSYSPGVPIYIYAIINDGVNTAVYSKYSSAIIPVPNLIGKVTDQFGNPISGIRVFLDLNNDQNYDAPVFNASGAAHAGRRSQHHHQHGRGVLLQQPGELQHQRHWLFHVPRDGRDALPLVHADHPGERCRHALTLDHRPNREHPDAVAPGQFHDQSARLDLGFALQRPRAERRLCVDRPVPCRCHRLSRCQRQRRRMTRATRPA